MASEPKSAGEASSDGIGRRIAGRYRVEKTLGRGGMGVVYQVFDESTQRTLALKQVLKRAGEQMRQAVALFQREYHTLAQLAHPLIIDVYDYGVDESGPYYTMELLCGRDLHELAPLHWEKACALLRDVATSLAIIHSRRLVHRDVTPRNVRISETGRPKLIDFGAMIPIGETKGLVGTPPFIPPEAVNERWLDGRADLFSLGGVAYYLLTQNHAFGASQIGQLRDIWRSKPRPPSLSVPGIPPALDDLVMSLLSLDRLARPINAAEVIDRLSAIAELPQSEGLDISQAYLSTPTLVSREGQLAIIRKHMLRATRGRGATLVLRGASGMGRSRLLMACVLEAKLAGATVLRASAEDGQGEYGVARALAEELFEVLPDVALDAARPDAAVLCHAVPKLRERLWDRYDESVTPEVFEDPEQQRPALQAALRDFVAATAAGRYLTLAVDDVHRCDEPSVALLAALSRDAPQLRLVLAVTTDSGAETGPTAKAVDMLKRAGSCIELGGLSKEQSERLLGSVFGDVPNVSVVTDWVHRLSEGNPRICMELAQHLVDQGIARHEGGQWTLPASLEGQALPQSLRQEQDARVARLSEPARQLAQALSLVTDHAPLKLKDYVFLGETEHGGLFAALDELVAAQVVISSGEQYRFAHKGLMEALHGGLDSEQRQHIHARLAAAYESGGYDKPLVGIYHLQQAGQGQQALELLAPLLEADGSADEAFALQVECCKAGLELAEATERSPRERFFLRKRLLLMAARYDRSLMVHAKGAEEQLRKDSGLIFWDHVDEALAPAERIQQCLQLAQSEWEALPEAERGLNPIEAIQEIAAFCLIITSAAALTLDLDAICSLYSLVGPFRPLSPGIDLLAQIVGSVIGRLRGESVLDSWRQLVDSIRDPVPGVEEMNRKRALHVLSYYVALDESRIAAKRALACADFLQKNPAFVAHAWHIRMLVHLYNGYADAAHTCRDHMEQAAIQNPESDSHLGNSVLFEAPAYELCGDLMGLKQALVTVSERAEKYPGWVPHLFAQQGRYHRMRGDLARARTYLEKGLQLAAPGSHSAWMLLTVTLAETVLDQGHTEQARLLAAEALQAFQERHLDRWEGRQIARVLALAEAKLGQHQEAARRVEALTEEAESQGIGGVWLGTLYETRSRIALEAQDAEALAVCMRLTARHYEDRQNPALLAKYERLVEAAHRCRLAIYGASEVDSATVTGNTAHGMTVEGSRAQSVLNACENTEKRSQAALSLILQHTGASSGYLFSVDDGALELIAPLNEDPPPPDLQPMFESYCQQITGAWFQTVAGELPDDTAETADQEGSALVTEDGQAYHPLLITAQREGRPFLVGVAALVHESDLQADLDWTLVAVIARSLLAEREDLQSRSSLSASSGPRER